MAGHSILPIDVSQGIDQSIAECLGSPRLGDALNVRICGPGDVRACAGYASMAVALDDTATPATGRIISTCTTDGTGTLGLVRNGGGELFLSALRNGQNTPLYWDRIDQFEASANVPQLGGIVCNVLGAPSTTVGGAEQALCHSVQVHAHSTLGVIAVVNSTDGVVGTTVNRPTAAELRILQKGQVISLMQLTWSGAPGVYGTSAIIRDGYLAAVFGSWGGGNWTGTLVVWKLEEMASLTALPAPKWTHSLTIAAAADYGAPAPVMALEPAGDLLAVVIPGHGLLVRRFSTSTTSGPTACPATSVDCIWTTTTSNVWVVGVLATGVVTAQLFSATAVSSWSGTISAATVTGAAKGALVPLTLAMHGGRIHALYTGTGETPSFSDGVLRVASWLETVTPAVPELSTLDFGRPASRPLMVAADRGYMLSATYSEGISVLRSTYCLEMRFQTTAPYVCAEIAGIALEGCTPHNIQMQSMTVDPRRTSQLSSLALGTTELHEPQVSHVLEGLALPQFLICGAALSPDPFAAQSHADIDRNPRVGALLSWEILSGGPFLRGGRTRTVSGGAMLTHGSPTWITPSGRDIPGFPDAIPSFYAATGGGGFIPAGTYQLCVVAEHTDALGLTHRSPPSYPVTLAPGASNQTFTVNAPLGVPVIGRTDIGGGVVANGFSLSLYCTQDTGKTFFLVRQGIQPGTQVSFTTIPADSSKVLYTQAGQVARYSPPGMSCLAIGKERALAGGFWRSTEVRFSLLLVPGEGLAWPHPSFPQWRVQLPSEVRSVAALGDSWAIFCASGIYVVTGDGPDDNGAGGSFSPPQRMSTLSLASCKSVVESDEGVYFQATDGHIYVLQAGSAQCQRISTRIQTEFGIVRMESGAPTWQTVTGALIEPATGDLLLTQWGPDEVVAFDGTHVIWRYSRTLGAWSRDEVTAGGNSGGHAAACEGLQLIRLPGDGYTVMAHSEINRLHAAAQGSLEPTTVPTARLETTWMAPFGHHGDGQVSGLSVLAGYPRRSGAYPWDTGLTAATVKVDVLRSYDGATQSKSLQPFAGSSVSRGAPQWATIEMALAETKGRQLQVVLSWTDSRISIASLALQGAGFARMERLPDTRTG